MDTLESRLVWILGSPRSGSTWLLSLIGRGNRVLTLDEPGIGAHLGVLATGLYPGTPVDAPPDRLRLNDMRAGSRSYFFADRYRDAWMPQVRNLVLARLAAQVVQLAGAGPDHPIVALKEPNGSQGADILMEALPRSRMIFLLRDGRDVVDSELDAARPGAWGSEEMPGYSTTQDTDRQLLIRARAHVWLCRTEVVQRAYDAHPPELRRLVRYESLLADTEGEFGAIADWLGLDLGPGGVRAAVEELAFGSLDPEHRGEGRFARAATPGLWRENMSPEEQAALMEVLGPRLAELGYE